jgi:putative transcriptional regulator
MSSGEAAPAIRRHHNEATLAAYAAGSLWEAAGPVVQGHLDLCPHCRAVFHLAEDVGGACLVGLPPTPLAPDALRRVTERLGGAAAGGPARVPAAPRAAAKGAEAVVARVLRDARLRWLAPGVRHAVLLRGSAGGTLRLLRVRPGTALPRHAHRGTELTLVLEGAFSDETGRCGPGDLVEVEGEESHQPVAEGTADCLCLSATEGRFRFGGLLGALFGAVARV